MLDFLELASAISRHSGHPLGPCEVSVRPCVLYTRTTPTPTPFGLANQMAILSNLTMEQHPGAVFSFGNERTLLLNLVFLTLTTSNITIDNNSIIYFWQGKQSNLIGQNFRLCDLMEIISSIYNDEHRRLIDRSADFLLV